MRHQDDIIWLDQIKRNLACYAADIYLEEEKQDLSDAEKAALAAMSKRYLPTLPLL